MKKCKFCGKPMEAYQGRGRPSDYCKRRECYLERERYRVSKSYWASRVYIKKVCPECGESFVTHKSNKVYCCKACRLREFERKRTYRDRPEIIAYAKKKFYDSFEQKVSQ